MGLNCGIVGLPNVGKSTIFSALTAAPAEIANYPFCTIEPNVGIVTVVDGRLDKIAAIFHPRKVLPAVVEFVDIAGLVKGASEGEGLGNQFLGHIRQVNAITHVVRCFEDTDIVHVHGKIDPISDIEVINTELALADLETVEKRLSNTEKLLKSQDREVLAKARASLPVIEQIKKRLSEGKWASSLKLGHEEAALVSDLHLITMKKVLYVCNVDENSIAKDNDFVKKVREHAEAEGNEVIVVCGKLESEIAGLKTAEEKNEFMQASGIAESGLQKLISATYRILGLRTFFTAGEQEVRAWTFHEGDRAPQTAGVIHSDFERGFIRAEVYHCEDLFKFGTEAKVKEHGKFRVEGKEYVVKDADVMFFRFNV